MNEEQTNIAEEQERDTLESAIVYEQQKKLFHKSFLFFVVIGAIVFSYWLGLNHGKSKSAEGSEAAVSPEEAVFINKDGGDKTIDFGTFWKVWRLLS